MNLALDLSFSYEAGDNQMKTGRKEVACMHKIG